MDIVLRKARRDDLDRLVIVERGSTPNLSYVPNVFDEFVSDEVGEFIVAEADGQVVACGKFTVTPDSSAWLETLRVLPSHQGLGIGKRFYERFFEIAKGLGTPAMRMYTGLENVVSKGLAERFGFHLAATYRGAYLPLAGKGQPAATGGSPAAWKSVADPARAVDLLMPFKDGWDGFLVMNRTFFELTPALCTWLAQKGMVYEEPASGSVITLGARFMPEAALHIGILGGDSKACLDFGVAKGIEKGVPRLSCLFPPTRQDLQAALTGYGFQLEKSDFIVMEVKLR